MNKIFELAKMSASIRNFTWFCHIYMNLQKSLIRQKWISTDNLVTMMSSQHFSCLTGKISIIPVLLLFSLFVWKCFDYQCDIDVFHVCPEKISWSLRKYLFSWQYFVKYDSSRSLKSQLVNHGSWCLYVKLFNILFHLYVL